MRHAVITGGARGIGLAIAAELDALGWGVFLVSQQRGSLAAAAARMKNLDGSLAVDLGEGETAAQAVHAAVAGALDALDLLVLNAGVFLEDPLSAVREETFRRNMAVNLDANLFLTKHLLPVLRKSERARIVIVGSTAAYAAYPAGPVYGVAKWGLRGLALNLRHELRRERIGVTFLAPGGTLTDMWDEDEAPPGRLLQPRDVAVLVAALTELSDQAVVDEIVLRPIAGDVEASERA